jgi:hypothetical protein
MAAGSQRLNLQMGAARRHSLRRKVRSYSLSFSRIHSGSFLRSSTAHTTAHPPSIV